MDNFKICPYCKGSGKDYNVRYYFGVLECNSCLGLGVLKLNEKPFIDLEEYEAAIAESENSRE